MHKYKHTNTHTQIHIQKYTYTNTHTQIHIHKYKYTNTHTQIHIHKYPYTNTHTKITRKNQHQKYTLYIYEKCKNRYAALGFEIE